MSNPKLTARMHYDVETGEKDAVGLVTLMFGETVVAEVEAARKSTAAEGTNARKTDEDTIIEETVAPLLIHIFGQAMEDLDYE